MATASRPWHEEFFSGLWLQAQQNSFEPEESRSDAEKIQELLQLLPGTQVLDIPCGNGRIAVELAARGCQVSGVDRSRPLLQAARKMAQLRRLDVHWHEGDMWELDVPGIYDAAICLWGSLGYEDELRDSRFLAAVAQRLRPEGSLLLDVHVVETLLPAFEDRHWRWAGEILVLEQREYDALRGRIETEWTLIRGQTVERKHSSLRLYTLHELLNLLQINGFCQIEAFGSLEGEPFEPGAPRLILVAHRVERASPAEDSSQDA